MPEPFEPPVERARDGDVAAFERLVERFQDMAFAFAIAYLGDAEEARDACQDAFIEAYRGLSTLRVPRAFPAWLKRIVLKRCDRLRRGAAPTRVPLEAAEFAAPRNAEEPAERGPAALTLAAALATLPLGQRLAFTMTHLAGASQREIAAALGVPATTVKKRLHDARERLKEVLAMLQPLQCQRPSQDGSFSRRVHLFLAVRAGERERVAALLDQEPALVNASERWDSEDAIRQVLPFPTGQSPLMRAAQNDDLAMAELLLARGADPAGTCGCHNAETPLHAAALTRSLPIVELLLSRGAPLERRAFAGLMPLHLAVMRECEPIVRRLVAAGAAVDGRDAGGRTALLRAAAQGSVAMVRLLLALGADRAAVDQRGDGAAAIARRYGHDGIAALIEGGKDPAPAVTATTVPPPEMASMHDDALTLAVPTGERVLGRQLDALGLPIDGLGAIDAPKAPVADPDVLPAPRRSEEPLETGIKAVDLLAPLTRGGRISLHAGFGCGKMVLVAELMNRFHARRGAAVVWIGWEQRPHERDDLIGEFKELALLERVVLIHHREGDPQPYARLAARTAATIAADFRARGREVLLVVHEHPRHRAEVAELARLAGEAGGAAITALFLEPTEARLTSARLPADRDARIALDRHIGLRSGWPAIHPRWTRSRARGRQHATGERLRTALLELLRREPELDAKFRGPAAVERRLARARRLQAYLTQPFNVTEFFVGGPGIWVPAAHAARTCEAILAGDYDEVDRGRLLYVGATPDAPVITDSRRDGPGAA